MGKRLTEEERAWRTFTEKEFQTKVINLARENGWLVAHFHDSRRMVVRPNGSRFMVGDTDARGFPDLVIVKDGRIYFWELKKELGKTTVWQDEWIIALQECGFDAKVMRPHDWDEIEAKLTA